MAKVKIQGNASGTGTVTLTAPNTNLDRTITLPDSTGTVLMTDGDGSNLTNVGVDGIVSSANATAMTIDSSERVGCGTTTPPYQLSSHEPATASGTYFPMGITGGSHLTGYGVGLAFRSENTSNTQKAKCAIVGEGTGGGNNLTSLHICLNNVADTTTEVSLSDSKLEFTTDGRGLSQFTAKAWCKFNGIGTVGITDSHNVSSITDVNTGFYYVNFTNAMANSSYAAFASAQGGHVAQPDGWQTTYVSFSNRSASNTNLDGAHLAILVFGD